MPRHWAAIHRSAYAESVRAHGDLGIDTSRPIDPFLALQRSGVLVMRQTLDHLSGAYIPANITGASQPGVLININHPTSRQRYTAAHELWHHRRDREIVLDAETEWMARGETGDSDRERLAEAFASWFLMPPQLVKTTLATLGLSTGSLDEQAVYALALEMGTSYTATVRQLHGLRLIAAAVRDRLLRISPRSIKRALGAEDVAADAWRDVHRIGPGMRDRAVEATEGDVVVLELPEIPSSGYLWQTTAIPEIVDLVREEYQPQAPDVIGGTGFHRFVFSVIGSGEEPIRVELSRPWQPGRTADVRNFRVSAQPKPVPGVVDPSILVGAAA